MCSRLRPNLDTLCEVYPYLDLSFQCGRVIRWVTHNMASFILTCASLIRSVERCVSLNASPVTKTMEVWPRCIVEMMDSGTEPNLSWSALVTSFLSFEYNFSDLILPQINYFYTEPSWGFHCDYITHVFSILLYLPVMLWTGDYHFLCLEQKEKNGLRQSVWHTLGHCFKCLLYDPSGPACAVP